RAAVRGGTSPSVSPDRSASPSLALPHFRVKKLLIRFLVFELPHTILGTTLQSCANAVGTDSEGVHRKAQLSSQISACFDPRPLIFLTVLHNKLEAIRGQLAHATLEAFPAPVRF